MNLFASNLDKAKGALADSTGALAVATATLDAHRLAPADPGDGGAQKTWLSNERDLAEDVRIAEGVVAHWTGVVERLEAEAAKKAKEAENVAAAKEAQALRGLVSEIAADSAKLAAKVKKLEAHRERAAAAAVPDAEFLVRSKPGRVRPAIMDEPKFAWFDGDGRRYASNMTTDVDGRVIEATDRVRRQVVDIIREETQDPPTMPTRYADAIKLVDIDGRPL